MKTLLKERAIKLRREGLSYSEILQKIPVAKSTLSLWLRSIGLSKKQVQRLTEKKLLAILLYADDVVLLANDVISMKNSLAKLEEWANTWHMSIGHAKCGLFGAPGSRVDMAVVLNDAKPWVCQGWRNFYCK